MEVTSALNFCVTYRLDEYLAIVRSHALGIATPKDASALQGLTTRLLVAVVGSVMFLVKSHRIGTCHFKIDQAGINRRSKQGETSVPWSDVITVYRYPSGYLIQMGRGGMPIPFRVLSEDQRELLSSMIAQYVHVPAAT